MLVLALFTGLTSAAYAEPPDSTCMSGYWDDDDFDDAIVFSMAAFAVEALSPHSHAPFFVCLARLESATPTEHPAPLRPACSARAPPSGQLIPPLIDS